MVQNLHYSLSTTLDWSYGGVNSSLPGNGGADCAGFLSVERRLVETLAATLLSILYTSWGLRCISMPPTLHFVRKDRGGKRLLLVIVSMVLGMEFGYKFASKQLIYLLNPCHITTALQIYLLAAPPSRFVTIMFRIHINYLNGAILALLFPVTNTRVLPFEAELYWLQHTLMLVTPYYLLRLGGVYTIEDLSDMSWTMLSTGLLFLYHFLPLQAIGLMSEVNLNNMLCPAISDPFYGQNYRIAAVAHQSLCIPLVAKTFCAIATFFITTFPLTKVKDVLDSDVSFSSYKDTNSISCCCRTKLTPNGNNVTCSLEPPARGASSPPSSQPHGEKNNDVTNKIWHGRQYECTEEFFLSEVCQICRRGESFVQLHHQHLE